MAEPWHDIVGDFLAMTAGASSPALFRKWAGISLVAGACERRVWLRMGQKTTFPNLYTLLVAPPGVGKYIIEIVRDLWASTLEPGTKAPAFKVAPDSMTKASLIDALAKASNGTLLPGAPAALTYHSLLIAAEEFSVLLPQYDLEYIGTLNAIWNNKPLHEETRRTGAVRSVKIEFPQLNMLGGVQPGWLASVFPEEAWSTGLASRMLMIYASDRIKIGLFDDPGDAEEVRSQILLSLGRVSQLYGQAHWTKAAADLAIDWHNKDGAPRPEHSKLAYYANRRTEQHMPKLALVSAISRSGTLLLDRLDVERAIEWLTQAESVMPDIFRAMVGKSDSAIIEELHVAVTSAWAKNHAAPVSNSFIWKFLHERVPGDKIQRIIEAAEKSNVIARVGGTDNWVPRPKHEHGVDS